MFLGVSDYIGPQRGRQAKAKGYMLRMFVSCSPD